MHEFLVSAVAFIVLIGVMVVVHEFGHFAVAKYFKVRVESFSVGFGPRLFGIKYGDTDYKICLLPLGGFVKMTGAGRDHGRRGHRIGRQCCGGPGGLYLASPLAADADWPGRSGCQLLAGLRADVVLLQLDQ